MKKFLLTTFSVLLFAVSCKVNGPEEREPVTDITLCTYADALLMRYVENPVRAIWNSLDSGETLPEELVCAGDNKWTDSRETVFEYAGKVDGLHKFVLTISEIKGGGQYYSLFSAPQGPITYSFDAANTFCLDGTIRISIYKERRLIDWIEITGDGKDKTYATSRD